MIRSATFLPFLLLLPGCPGTEFATAGDPESTGAPVGTDGQSSTSAVEPTTSSTSAAEPTTGSSDSTGSTSGATANLDCLDLDIHATLPLAELCELWPWGNQECDTREHPRATCQQVILTIANIPACADIDFCDYRRCSVALQNGPCDAIQPSGCEEIVECAGFVPTAVIDCCEKFGAPSAGRICGASIDGFCIDCNFAPVLCTTHGCSTPGEEDCCLSEKGETVPCAVPLTGP